MALPVAAKITIEVAKILADKNKRNTLFIIIGSPLILIIIISSMFFYRSTDINDTFILSVRELKAERKIENELDGDLTRSIYMIHNKTLTEDIIEVKDFILTYFYKEKTQTVIVDDKDNDDPSDDDTVEETTRWFFNYDEIISRVKQQPFLFTDEMVAMLDYFKPYPELEIDDNFVAPCSGIITSQFGTRIHPVSGKIDFHTGIDISGKWHQSIMSVADGEVVTANTAISGYGNYVMIKHTFNDVTFYSFYAHLSSISVKVGQSVNRGETIGKEGGALTDNNPGTSTGHHLHFEIRQTPTGGFLNPQNIFKKG